MHPVLIIKNTPAEGPGELGRVLADADVPTRVVEAGREPLFPPSLENFCGLILLGGPQGVYEKTDYPYLEREIELARDGLSRRLPMIGFCLGMQLLAAALGADVKPGEKREIGWAPIQLAPEATRDQLLADVAADLPVFHFHGDVAGLPAGAVNLARTATTPCQAFRYGDRVYGFQWHLEANAPLIEAMIGANREYVRSAGFDADAIQSETPSRLAAFLPCSRRVLARWVRRLKAE